MRKKEKRHHQPAPGGPIRIILSESTGTSAPLPGSPVMLSSSFSIRSCSFWTRSLRLATSSNEGAMFGDYVVLSGVKRRVLNGVESGEWRA